MALFFLLEYLLVSRLVHIHNNCPICSHLRCHRQLA